jgi:thiamine-phosphate pyrophosphorylase
MQLTSHFYAMVDAAGGHDPVALAEILLDGGVTLMQLRLKEASSRDFLAAARTIARLCREHSAMLVVNDRADIARLSDAAGVHVGQEDLPLAAARQIVGPGKVIGVSTHTIEQAVAAEREGADYIGFGAIYGGGLKNARRPQGLERLREVRAAVKLPIVAIGGITEQVVPEVLAAGADATAIITDVVRAPDIRAKVRAILAICPQAKSELNV